MTENKYLLSSVRNALKILNSFSEEEPELRVSDVAEKLGIAKSTVSRLMGTLSSEGFVIRDPDTQRYRLGLSVLNLSGIVTSTIDVHREARPILEDLSKSINETCHLVFLEGLEVIYLLKVESKHHPVRFSSHIGRKNPAYCTSSGKVLLAYQSEDVVENIIDKGLHPYLPGTITDPEKLRQELQKVRDAGYAISIEELFSGVASVGAPIRNYEGKVIAAVTIVGPIQRIHRQNIQQYAKRVVEVGKEISERLGYYGL